MYKYSLISLLVSFLLANTYWILTSLYIKKVINSGEKGTLWGFEAAIQNIKVYGFKVYLEGMGTFFSVTFFTIVVFLVVAHKIELGKAGSLFFSLCISFIGATIYYLFFVELISTDYTTSEVIYLSGFDLIQEVGIRGALRNIVGIWVLITVASIIAKILSKPKKTKNKSRGQPA